MPTITAANIINTPHISEIKAELIKYLINCFVMEIVIINHILTKYNPSAVGNTGNVDNAVTGEQSKK